MKPALKQDILSWFSAKLKLSDLAILVFFTILVIFNPFYLHQNLNLFELGLYLPGIGAVLDGQIPYRDFFHLRGPFELYVPALMMKMFGENVAVLSTYFYIGNILCLLICILIAYRIFPNRWIFYSFVLVLVARTYPRVVYTYWGGFRYAWGLLAIYCLVEFLLRKKKGWIWAAGILTSVAGLTSMEVGVSAAAAISLIILGTENRLKNLISYCGGVGIILVPYVLYLSAHDALGVYVQSQWMVATQMTKTFLQTEPVPSNLKEVLSGWLNPGNKNFRQMTPVYCYIFYLVYWIKQRRQHQLNAADQAILGIAVYGFVLYVTGFRNLWASVFEMSLQPEKIVLFYLLCSVVHNVGVIAGERRERSSLGITKIASSHKMLLAMTHKVLIAAIILSSIGYSFDRFNKRFLFFRKMPFKNEEAEFVYLPRIRGMKVSAQQARDFNQLWKFTEDHIPAQEKVWMYPELGALHFILNRLFIGKFPTATLAWMNEDEYARYMKELVDLNPKYAIVNKEKPDYFDKSYFPLEKNVRKYQEQMSYLNNHYSVVYSTPTYNVYLRKH